jgi:hypothetical protein
LPRHKCKQGVLVAESRRLDLGVRGNAGEIEGCRRSEQVASGTLCDVGEDKVQDSLRKNISTGDP